MSLFDEDKKTTRVDIDSVDDIYKHEKQILDTVKRYVKTRCLSDYTLAQSLLVLFYISPSMAAILPNLGTIS